ncbi:MAG: Uma2 family endonuclease [Cyanobacteria bacterium P01_F01_bin.53]
MLQISQLDIAPGQAARLRTVTWQQYKKILKDLGTRRTARIAYYDGRLEIMVPSTRNEDDKEIISDLMKVLMEERHIDFRALGSTTFERRSDLTAIEPDQCFYIQHEQMIRGKHRIDLKVDPPPDLVVEINKETHSHFEISSDISPDISKEIYETLKVAEFWRFGQAGLSMYQLCLGKYVEVDESPLFPSLPIKDLLPYCLEQSRTLGRNVVVRDFRQWVRDNFRASIRHSAQ